MKTKFRTYIRTFTIVAASLLLVGAGLVSGCSSSPDSRIRRNQELFNSLPPEAQASIRAGQVQVGFTPDMVLLALGEPNRRYMRTNDQGSSEVWAYTARSSSSSVSVGLGLGMGMGSRSRMSTAIGVTSGGGDQANDWARIVFQGGKVSNVEQATSR